MRLLRMHWPILVGIATLAALVGLGMAQEAAARRGKPMYAELRRPPGPGPFPALVLLHGCSGITSVQRDWAERLSEWGYVTLIVDSFGPREVRNVCWSGPDGPGSYAERVQDARSALGHLRRQPFVDPRRIGAIGWSMGAGVTLRAVEAGRRESPRGLHASLQARFKAAVAFYPHCRPIDRYGAPLLILIGDKDDWAPASRCRALARGRPAGQGRVQLVVYPNAYHSFDGTRPMHQYRGHVIAADPEATADAIVRVRDFLAKYL